MGSALSAVSILFQPTCLLLVCVGAILGMLLGAIPGLSGGIAIIILLPATFSMDANVAIAMLIAIWVGSCSGSCIGSILLGIPGSSSSIATVYDGYELTKQGDPVRALSAALVSNFVGTFPSVLVAMVLCPIIADFAVKLGPWEYFSLGFGAIMMVTGVSKGDALKGIVSMGLAIMLTSVGCAPVSGTQRFVFGNYYLSGGFDLVSVMTGLFAGTTILVEYARGTKVDSSSKVKVTGFRFPGKDFLANKLNALRSFIIGLIVGFLPGLGSALSNVVAYGLAKSSSKHSEEFGKGCIDGVIAPEVANNASVGGAIIPMISLGIPGDTTTAFLLGGLIIHGVEAGPLMIQEQPVLVNMIYLAALFGAVFVLAFQVLGMRMFPTLLKIPYHYMYPVILIICFIGAYVTSGNIYTIILTIIFTLVGVVMNYFELPMSPFILTFVLSDMLETNLRKAISYSDIGVWSFFVRPISCVLLLIGFGCIVYPYIKNLIKKLKAAKA